MQLKYKTTIHNNKCNSIDLYTIYISKTWQLDWKHSNKEPLGCIKCSK